MSQLGINPIKPTHATQGILSRYPGIKVSYQANSCNKHKVYVTPATHHNFHNSIKLNTTEPEPFTLIPRRPSL